MRAVVLENPTDALLPAGTITAYGPFGFDGNALLGDVPGGAQRTVRFALDAGVRVEVRDAWQPEIVTFVRLSGGVLETEVRTRLRSTFAVSVQDDVSRTVLVEWPAPAGFAWVGDGPEPQRAENTWRVAFDVGEPDDAVPSTARADVVCLDTSTPCRFDTVVERVDRRTLRLVDASDDRLALELANGDLSAEARRWIDRLVSARRTLADLTSGERRLLDDVDAIVVDQARMRENLSVLEPGSSLYLRYLGDLEESEDALADARGALDDLRNAIDEARRALQDVVRQLP